MAEKSVELISKLFLYTKIHSSAIKPGVLICIIIEGLRERTE